MTIARYYLRHEQGIVAPGAMGIIPPARAPSFASTAPNTWVLRPDDEFPLAWDDDPESVWKELKRRVDTLRTRLRTTPPF